MSKTVAIHALYEYLYATHTILLIAGIRHDQHNSLVSSMRAGLSYSSRHMSLV